MGLEQHIFDDLKAAMKAGEKDRTAALRLIRSQLKNAEIEKGATLSEEDVLVVLNREAKKRRESIEMYQKGGRQELAAAEGVELEIISAYLPKALSIEELSTVIDKVISETGAAGMKDMGRVMGLVMTQVQGRADGKQVQQVVREKLGS